MTTSSPHLDPDYMSDRDAFIESLEDKPLFIGSELLSAPENPGDGTLTVGFGYNMSAQSYAQIQAFMLHALGYPDGTSLSQLPSNIANALQAIQSWKSGGAIPAQSTLSALALNKAQAEVLLNEYLDGYGSYSGLESSLDGKLGFVMPQSQERIAVLDALYHNVYGKLVQKDLQSLDASDARANAWFELRYNDAGPSNPAFLRGGLAARAYIDGQVFDLYDATVDPSGDGSPNLSAAGKADADADAAAAYRVFTLNKATILQFDQQFSSYITYNQFKGVTASTLDVSLLPSWDYLASKYTIGFNVGEENIWAAPTALSNPNNTVLLPWDDNSTKPGDYLVIGGQGNFSGALFAASVPQSAGALVLAGDNGGIAADNLTQLGSLDKGLWSGAKFSNGFFEANLLAPSSSANTQNFATDLANDVLAVGGAGFPVLENSLSAATGSSPTVPSFYFGGGSAGAALGSSTSWQVSGYGTAELKVQFNATAGLELTGGGSPGVIIENNLTADSQSVPNIAPTATSLLIGASAGADNVTDVALAGSYVLVAQGDGNTLVATHGGDVLIADGNNNTFEDIGSGGASGEGESSSPNSPVIMIGGAIDGQNSKNDTFISGSGGDIMIGGTGTNVFDIKQTSNQKDSNPNIVWGGGGTSTYNFTGSDQIFIINIQGPTIGKIYSLESAQFIASIHTIYSGSLTVIVNPSSSDTITLDGKAVTGGGLRVGVGDVAPAGGYYYGGQNGLRYEALSQGSSVVFPGSPTDEHFSYGFTTNGKDDLNVSDPGTSDTLGITNFINGQFGATITGNLPPDVHGLEPVDPSFFTNQGTYNVAVGADGDTLSGGQGQDVLAGTGAVTYDIGQGNGLVAVAASAGGDAGTGGTVDLDSSFSPSGVTVASGSTYGTYDDIVIKDAAGDGVDLQAARLADAAPITQVNFSDGTVLTFAELLSTVAAEHVIDGQGAARDEGGNGDGDIFVYNAGYGALNITEYQYGSYTNILKFGPGITQSQITVSTGDYGSLILSDGIAGDSITLGEMRLPEWGVQEVQFADGTSLTKAQLVATVNMGTTGADTLYGPSPAYTFDGKGAPAGSQDYEIGRGGGDVFLYDQGYGHLEVSEYDLTNNPNNALQLGAGITAAQIQVTGDDAGNIYLTDGTSGDRIQLDGELNGSPYGVQTVQFADGTSWTAQQLIATLPITITGDGEDVRQSNGSIAFADNEGSTPYTATLEGSTDTVALQNGYSLTATGNGNTLSVSGSSNVTAVGQNNTVSASAAPAAAAYTFVATGDNNTMIAGAGTGTLSASGDQNTLQGGSGADDLSFTGNDNLFLGGAGTASVTVAGSGNVLVGGAGQMIFIAQSGSGNIYEAGPGHVTVDYSQDPEAVSVDLTAGTASFGRSTGVDQLDYIPEVHIGSNSSILAGAMPVVLVADGNDSTLIGGSGYDSLTATGSGNTLQAGAGGANLTATGNANLLEGGTTFYAVLAASGNHNTLQGGSGTNTLIVSGDSNLLTSGGGYEEVDVTGNDNSLDAYDSNVYVTLTGDGNQFTGGTNYASVFIDGSDNVVVGGSQVTSIAVQSGSGNTYSPGAGLATLDYSADTQPVHVDLATGSASFAGSSGIDTIEGITQVTIGSNSSILAGSTGTNLVIDGDGSTLQGGDGFDVLTANGNGDTLIAGSAGGNLTASGSSNLLKGGSAYTVMTAYGDQNTFQGGTGTNTFVSYGERNVLTGGGGYEDITLYGDDDTLHTDASNTALTVNGDGNHVTGGSDYTSVSVSGSNNVFTGGSAAIDFKSFGGGGNSFDGGTGRASLDYSGNPLAASVNLAAGTASFAGSSGVDTLSNISVLAVGSNSSMLGDSGPDSLYIFGNGSTLQGGSGNDMLTAYGQDDTLTAGSGGGILSANGTNDVYSTNPANTSVTIQNHSGTDTAANQLSFVSDADTEQLWFTESGNDLQIQALGSAHTTTVQNWFSDPASQLQEINSSDGWQLDTGVSQLVQAMATYDASHPGFAPATASIMPTDSTLQGAIAAAWHH